MFHLISKTLGLLIEPYYLALALLLPAMILRLSRRAPRLRRGLAIFAAAYVVVMACGPMANLLLYPLETAHPRPARLPDRVGAVIMLGGVSIEPVESPADYELSGAADRFVEAVRLAHRFPAARLLITGGSSAIIDDAFREADVLGRLARQLGLPARQILTDRDSQNTYQNARNSEALLRGVPGPYLLITSAVHMPRSVACFRKQGLQVIPWPVDFRRTGSGPGAWLPKPQTLARTSAALHEYAGWLAYWLAGYV